MFFANILMGDLSKMKDFIRYWIKNTLKIGGSLFGAIGAISVLFPMTDLTQSNFQERVQLLIIISAIVVVLSLIYTVYIKSKKSKLVYNFGITKIIFEYNDLKKIIEYNTDDEFTVVIPINSNLNVVGDSKKINKNSVHRIFYDYFTRNGQIIDLELLKKVEKKHMSNIKDSPFGQIGDWFLLTSKEIAFDTKIRFLLIEVNESEKKPGGFWSPKALSKEKYIFGLIATIKVISEMLDQEEKVYIPLIGAGNANVAKPRDAMFLMEELLRFYKGKLRQEIHVVIMEKNREDDAEIYQLREIR